MPCVIWRYLAPRIDDLPGENRLKALLGLEHDAENAVAVLYHVDAPRMEEHLDLALRDHGVHQVLRRLGIYRRLPVGARAVVAGPRPEAASAEGGRAIHELLADAVRHEFPSAAVRAARRREHDEHHAVGEKPAKRTRPFHKRDLRARPCGGDRCREASWAAAHHDHVRLVENGNLARRTDDLAVFHVAARAILDGMRNGEYPLPEPDVVGIADGAGRQGLARRDIVVAKRRAGHAGRAEQSKLLQEIALTYLHDMPPC